MESVNADVYWVGKGECVGIYICMYVCMQRYYCDELLALPYAHTHTRVASAMAQTCSQILDAEAEQPRLARAREESDQEKVPSHNRAIQHKNQIHL